MVMRYRETVFISYEKNSYSRFQKLEFDVKAAGEMGWREEAAFR